MKKHYIPSLACGLAMLTLTSCFQNMDHPAFDYPESTGVAPETPLLMYLPFDEEDIRDKGEWGFIVADNGNAQFSDDAASGMSYLGASDAYILARTPSVLGDGLADLGSCTVAFWMKAEKNNPAYGIFCIPNTKTFWGNFELYLENHSSPTEAFFKIHLYTCNATQDNIEKWVEAKVENVFGTEWVHMAFVYDGNTSTMTVYRNGEVALTQDLAGYGPLKFKDVGASLAVGAFQFSTTPSLTEGASAQTWASNFIGQLDQFRFYNAALSADDIRTLYGNKE